MALGPLAPIDRATLAYVAVALAFNLARGPRTWPAAVLLPLGLLLVALVAALLAPLGRRAGPLGRFVAEFYPLMVMIGLYTHVGLVDAAGGVSHDALVQRWEEALFGGQPSLEWIRAFPSPAWSTLMHAAYLSLATVYGQFHYAVDALAGVAVAAAALFAGRRAGYDSPPALTTHRSRTTHGDPR